MSSELKEKMDEAKKQVNDFVKEEEEKMRSNLPSRENGDKGARPRGAPPFSPRDPRLPRASVVALA